MRFALSEDAAALRDAAAGLLESEVPAAVVRAGWPGGDRDLVLAAWRKLAAAGAVGTLVPEARGGLGLDETSLVPLLEELGYSGLPVPAAETIAVAAPLLDGARLADVLAGDTLVAAQLGGGGLVPFGQHAALVIVGDGGGEHGGEHGGEQGGERGGEHGGEHGALRIYDTGELALEPCATVDGSRGAGRLARRPGDGGTLLTGDPAAVESAWQRGVLGTSALLTGLARRMLDMTVGYVKQREQYGVPVGSFQAIKHALASALVAVEFARPMVLAAGWAQAAGAPDAGAQTSAAKVLASDAARQVARTAIQCHGAMGYTTEYDLHLYAKRAWALAPSWGSAGWHRARLARSLGVADD
jgi:alkylation response protein AidB-like acyl-CoA dehydrogenase